MRIFAGVPQGWGRQMKMALSSTAIFGDFDGYFFGNFRDKASNIIWRYATPFGPVIDCKINDLEWLFRVKIRFRSALLDSERLTFKNNCVKSNKYRTILSGSAVMADLRGSTTKNAIKSPICPVHYEHANESVQAGLYQLLIQQSS